jgi:hypothetical protein
MLAIVRVFQEWRHYLQSVKHTHSLSPHNGHWMPREHQNNQAREELPGQEEGRGGRGEGPGFRALGAKGRAAASPCGKRGKKPSNPGEFYSRSAQNRGQLVREREKVKKALEKSKQFREWTDAMENRAKALDGKSSSPPLYRNPSLPDHLNFTEYRPSSRERIPSCPSSALSAKLPTFRTQCQAPLCSHQKGEKDAIGNLSACRA